MKSKGFVQVMFMLRSVLAQMRVQMVLTTFRYSAENIEIIS